MLYIGPYKIKSKENKGDYVKVVFEDKNEPLLIKQKMYEKILSVDKVDLTALRDRRVLGPVQDIIKVLLDWDVKTIEVDPIFQQCTNFINDKLDYVGTQPWAKRMGERLPEKWVPGDIFSERTMVDLDSFFKDDKTKDNKATDEGNKTSS